MAVVEHEVPQMMTSIKAADPGYQSVAMVTSQLLHNLSCVVVMSI